MMTISMRMGFVMLGLAAIVGCGNGATKDRDFHTSGNRDADQRAEQRVAQVQQIRGEGSGGGKEAKNIKPPLFERLGGEAGMAAIVDDFVTRAIADPRVNFERKGIKKGGVLGVGGKTAEWQPTPENQAVLKKHITQFLSLATGGPAKYDGQEMKTAHIGMKITNDEFSAAIGDMKASLDARHIPVEEQKELIAILESTRTQVVEEK